MSTGNKKVSQLIELDASDLQLDDLFLIQDVSVKESKKMEVGTMVLYLQNSGSLSTNALHAINSDSASYILGSNVDGLVNSAFNASTSSWANKTISSSYADTASVALTTITCVTNATTADSSSYLIYSVNNGSASYAVNAGVTDAAQTAYYLYYNGQPNGTASWAVNAVNTSNNLISDTASYLLYIPGYSNGTSSYATSSEYAVTASYAVTTSYSNTTSYAITASYITNTSIKAFAQITWSTGVASPHITMQNNISSFTYLDKFTNAGDPSHYVSPSTWSQFGVIFSAPLDNTNYMVMGDGYQPYILPERAGIIVHPIHSNRTTGGFTMSINTANSSDFYTTTSGVYPNDEYGYINFQVLGV